MVMTHRNWSQSVQRNGRNVMSVTDIAAAAGTQTLFCVWDVCFPVRPLEDCNMVLEQRSTPREKGKDRESVKLPNNLWTLSQIL